MNRIKLQICIAIVLTGIFLSGCVVKESIEIKINSENTGSQKVIDEALNLNQIKEGIKRRWEADEPDYLIKEEDVLKGVLISEHVSETEAFIGQLLMEAVEKRGKLPEEKRQYFSKWALEQLGEASWEELGAGWTADPCLYERCYTLTFLFGNIGYDFSYSFHMDTEKSRKDTAQSVKVQALVDGSGVIRGVDIGFDGTPDRATGADGLFRDEFQETVIKEGVAYVGKVVYEEKGKGVLATGDAALDGEALGKIIIGALESGDLEGCRDLFENEDCFWEFKGQKWEQLDEGWKADCYFDCYYTYITREKGFVEFLYYIYPDYDRMKQQRAKALTFRCVVGTADGKMQGTELRTYDMTQEEYSFAREWKGREAVLIEDGEIIGGGGLIRIPGQHPEEGAERINTYKDMGNCQLVDILMKDLDVGDLEDGKTGGFVADKESTLIVEIASEIRKNTAGGWQLGEKYDFYYLNHNEQTGNIHYRYHFYWNKLGEEEEKVLVTDVWISSDGIEDMQIHWYMTRKHLAADVASTSVGEKADALDIGAFLKKDWTTDEVLLWGGDHTIIPDDSAQGWKFAIADVDFDGICEFLIIFTSNHCGTNSLYIYRQEKGAVFSYVDTIATPQNHIANGIDYRGISPYMDIALMDAYVNKEHDYRYLSLDCSLFGGDIHGGIYTVILYETTLEKDAVPKEIARIIYSAPEEKEEMYFLGEKVYETGKMRDMIADYMEGYEEVEIDYKIAEKMFQRDIVSWNEEEKIQELNQLYDSLKELANG